MSVKTILVWFRNDLRIHDNEILLEAVQKADNIVAVYCFDPFYFKETKYGTLKTGSKRAKFTIESVADLKTTFKNMGGDLIVKIGKPEEIILELALKYEVKEVYHHREVAFEETAKSAAVEEALWKIKINLKHFIGHTLFHKEDLPFPIKDIPDVFTVFRKKVERDSFVKKCFDTPKTINFPEEIEETTLPTLADLGLQEDPADERGVMEFLGGEKEGVKRLNNYFWENENLKNYKNTRNGLIGSDYSTKLSPWLSMGCLSPREIYWQIKKYEQEKVSNDSTYWLYFELLWRDYFRFMFKKHGNKFFHEEGFKGVKQNFAPNQQELLQKWKDGQTGIPFIDANMRELNQTGFMSNRGRQNAASFLAHDLNVNWTLGAAYFEEKLIDYAPASNWGNWAYIAGVGNDPRENRQFNIIKQANDYDEKGDYVRIWVPELAQITGNKIHEPYRLSEEELLNFKVVLGKDYPQPIATLKSFSKV